MNHSLGGSVWSSNWWLSPTPLKNMISSMGRMTSHILWKIKNVPNHQAVFVELNKNHDWLVGSIPLKNISQLGLLFPIYGKIKNVPNHQPDET